MRCDDDPDYDDAPCECPASAGSDHESIGKQVLVSVLSATLVAALTPLATAAGRWLARRLREPEPPPDEPPPRARKPRR